jgi:tetratricopeptide (TPR) repeat protein
MNSTFSRSQIIIARLLLVSFVLASCNNNNIPQPSQASKATVKAKPSSRRSDQKEEKSILIDSERDHLVAKVKNQPEACVDISCMGVLAEEKEQDKKLQPKNTSKQPSGTSTKGEKEKLTHNQQNLIKKSQSSVDQQQLKSHTYAEALEILQAKHSNVTVINLSQEKLNKKEFKALKKAVNKNPTLGYIHWGEIPTDCKRVKKKIESKLVKNICTYAHHPSDYAHGLFSSHVYNNPKEGEEVDLRALSKNLGHDFPTTLLTNWKVIQAKDDSKSSGFYSALYVNEATRQAVLAFQGTNDLIKDLMIEDMQGVLGNANTRQQELVYEAAETAVSYVNQHGLHLSITGHSLGGYLAELAVVYCYLDFEYRQVKAIVFDSPGTARKLDTFQSNIINLSTEFKIADLPIITYLSAPNPINTCNAHPGEAYRVQPELKWEGWLEILEKVAKEAGNIPVIGEDIGATNKGLLTLTGHSLTTILNEFDPITGKPKEYVRIADWPKLKTDSFTYTGKKGKLSGYIGSKMGASAGSGLGTTMDIPGAYTVGNIVGGFIGNRIGRAISKTSGAFAFESIASVLLEYSKIGQSQFWETLEHLDENYKQPNLEAEKAFRLNYEGHYDQSSLKPDEHILHIDTFRSVDWYLYELYKYRNILKKVNNSGITLQALNNILADYEVIELSGRAHIKLKPTQKYVEALRDKMRRALAVLSSDTIEQAIGPDMVRQALIQCMEKPAIQALSQLHSYIAAARLKDYIPRLAKEQELSQKLEKANVCVVYGYKGVGKKTLVAEYGHANKAKQPVWWMQAETAENLLSSYQKLAQDLGINYQDLAKEVKQKPNEYLLELTRRIYNFLTDRKQSILLILNDAEDPALITDCLLHRNTLTKTIITTRNKIKFRNYDQVELTAFSLEEGKTYIRKNLASDLHQFSESDILTLINEVGLIPKKLALAVGYIKERRLLTIGGYVNKLKDAKKLDKKGTNTFELPEASLGLEILDFPAQLVMLYSAYLDPQFIPLSLISEVLKIEDEQILEKALITLEELSLINIISNEGNQLGIQIDREIQAACKAFQGWSKGIVHLERDIIKNLITVLNQLMPQLPEIPDHKWEQAKLYASNVDHVLANTSKEIIQQQLAVHLLDWMGNYYTKVQFNYEQALHIYQQALAISESIYSANHSAIADLSNNIGKVYRHLGLFQEALAYLNKSYTISVSIYSADHPDVADLLNNIGNVYADLGQLKKALEYYKKSRAIIKSIYSPNHPFMVDLLNDIGNAYSDLGQFQKSSKYYKRARAISKSIYSTNHPAIASLSNNIGNVYADLGQPTKALEYYEKPLEIQEAIYIGNHPDVAILLNNIGNAYSDLGQPQKGLEYYLKSLAMRKAIYPANHPAIAASLHNMGVVYFELDQPQEALKCYNKTLEMMKSIYPVNHPDIASLLNNIGNFYADLGHLKEGLKYYKKSRAIRRAIYPTNHPAIAASLNNIGTVYADLGRPKRALKYYKKSLAIKGNVYAGNHPAIATSLNNLGSVYFNLSQPQAALEYYNKSRAMIEAIYPLNHPAIVTLLNSIGDVYKTLGENQEAAKYFNQANEIISRGQPFSNNANRYQTWWNVTTRWLNSLASWWKEEATGMAIDTDHVHIKELLMLKSKCQDLIQEAATVSTDKWYVYSLEDMVADIDKILKRKENIDEDTLKYFNKRLRGVKRDFLEEEIMPYKLPYPYKSDIVKPLEPVQLLLPEFNALSYQGSNMLALP